MRTPLRPSRETLHMLTALQWAKRSVCKRAQVGCIITTGDMKRVISFGYNGPRSKLDHDSCNFTEGNCGCLHAESNALERAEPFTQLVPRVHACMFTTSSPCKACAEKILQSRFIWTVRYLKEYRDPQGLEILNTAGRDVKGISADELFGELQDLLLPISAELHALIRKEKQLPST